MPRYKGCRIPVAKPVAFRTFGAIRPRLNMWVLPVYDDPNGPPSEMIFATREQAETARAKSIEFAPQKFERAPPAAWEPDWTIDVFGEELRAWVMEMENTLLRAQHYLDLAAQMHKTAKLEPDENRRAELTGLANQYEKLGEKIYRAHQANTADASAPLDLAASFRTT